jgi:hypothetical protein
MFLRIAAGLSFSLALVLGAGSAIASTATDVELPPFCTCGKKAVILVVSNQGDDPDMGGREGVPPNTVGTGTRNTQEEIDYWRLINGSKAIKSRGSGRTSTVCLKDSQGTMCGSPMTLTEATELLRVMKERNPSINAWVADYVGDN